MRLTIKWLLTAALSAIISGKAAATERHIVQGTSVSLNMPAGFEPAKGFSGLQNPTTSGSVVVVELPAQAHSQLSTLFGDLTIAKTNFARQNVTIEDRGEIETASGKVPVLSGSQSAGGVTFDKWVALFKGTKTVMVTVQSPDASELDDDAVHGMLKSVSLGAEPNLADKLNALPFAVTVVEPFRIVDTIGGSGVLMTAGPLDADPARKQPLIIIAYQLSKPAGVKAEELATALLKQTRGLETATISGREVRTFAGSEGYLLSGANAEGKRFDQYLGIAPNGRFVRLIAIADADAFDGLKPAIEKVAATIAFRPAK